MAIIEGQEDGSPAVRSQLLDDARLRDHLQAIVASEDDLTIFSANVVFQRLAHRLSIPIESIKEDEEVKKFVKATARQVIEAAAEQREALPAQPNTEDALQSIIRNDELPQPTSKKRKSSKKEEAAPKKKRKANINDEPSEEAIKRAPQRPRSRKESAQESTKGETEKHRLGRLIRTLKFPPSIYKDLDKENVQEYIRELRERLVKLCLERKVVSSSRLPTLTEAQQWIKKKEFLDELTEIGLEAAGLTNGTLPEGAKRKRSVKSWASEFERIAKVTSAESEESSEEDTGEDDTTSETTENVESSKSRTPATNSKTDRGSAQRSGGEVSSEEKRRNRHEGSKIVSNPRTSRLKGTKVVEDSDSESSVEERSSSSSSSVPASELDDSS